MHLQQPHGTSLCCVRGVLHEMVLWRAAGINYVRFSQIAAEVTKQCTKSAKGAASKASTQDYLKMTAWENGKAVKKLK
ncbi:hypothetical protein NECAME_01263 [Necator americanus]|uniref:Uncharacterized protein n=1 Tax=Necator americanus TaxID=51031 RepID=W2TZK0_NECAM|nr:hypothetical protein NECAME_01263 [Necator americanus]ETN87104.1 hypothetical protein NECAME_01263 [Necator americanus]